MHYAKLKGLTLYPFISKNDNSTFGFKADERRLATDAEAEKAFMVIYYHDLDQKDYFRCRDIPRSDPHLVQTIEDLGQASFGRYATLAIADVPCGTQYRIDEYDGYESVMTIADYEWLTA